MKKVAIAVVCATAVLTAAQSGAGAGSSIVVGNVWSRPATVNAVVYASIRNGGSSNDALIDAAAPGAQHAELHETTAGHGGNPMSPMQGMSSTVSMKRVASATVPAGGELRLQPGSYHIMLIGLKRSWRLGDSFQIRLRFQRAGWISTNGIVSAQ